LPDAKATNAKFMPASSVLSGELLESLPANSLLHRVGDLGRWLPDGTIECLGRTDSQVKLRGYPII
jgi:non-ribosomal peptide synthetase component F